MGQKDEQGWKRLESVITWSDMTINHFAKQIGLSRSEAIYQIQKGNNGLSRKMAELVVTAFPQINLIWLLNGRGEMFVTEADESVHVDLYEADAETQIASIDELEPTMKMVLPTTIEADLAMRYRGAAMSNTIPADSVVVLKRIEREAIVPGYEYLIVTKSITALRIVRRQTADSSEPMLRLVATMSEQFDDLFVTVDQITLVYKVVAKLIINS